MVATAIALSTRQNVLKVWNENFLWSAPSYFVGAGVAAASLTILGLLSVWWVLPLAAAPLYVTYHGYKVYLGRIDDEQRHVREMADLHLATIEALALAIDAKDQTSQSHIRRVQLYAAALARALGMSENDIQGVKTAALLHDIGKLAVPEHILSKPGPLTPEEFQKIRAHPKVGADIISAVPFPYPVSPLILSHHERWDGKGYPAGLKGEEIPLGARILSVVDYFDALMAERPYHKAMGFDAAIGLLQQEAGKGLDPRVVEKFIELLPDAAARGGRRSNRRCRGRRRTKNSRTRSAGRRPGSRRSPRRRTCSTTSRSRIARFTRSTKSRRRWARASACRRHDGADLREAQQPRAVFVRGVVPVRRGHRNAALPIRDRGGRRDHPADHRPHRRRTDRLGRAQPSCARERAPERGSRSCRPGRLQTNLQSALVCPLLFSERFIGTLSVYHVDAAYYRDDHRRLLDRVSEQAAAVINNSMLFEQTQEDSLTDPLTGLPNTRFLFMHLTRELARAERLKQEVSLLVMDLDNFKSINDSHGHHVGDRALCEVARVLRTAIRPYDICVRYAGDEFIVVLSGCNADEAREQARRAAAEHRRRVLRGAAGKAGGARNQRRRRGLSAGWRVVRGAPRDRRQPDVSGQVPPQAAWRPRHDAARFRSVAASRAHRARYSESRLGNSVKC